MTYLTYLIEHYDRLPDVVVFMHAHETAWHNNDLLGNSAVQMLRRFNWAKVVRDGYVNLRCHWDPGCPAWLHPGVQDQDLSKLEQGLVRQAWAEL